MIQSIETLENWVCAYVGAKQSARVLLIKPASGPEDFMPSTSTTSPDAMNTKAVPILARSWFRQMREQGYSKEQIVVFSAELLGLVSRDLQQQEQDRLAAQ